MKNVSFNLYNGNVEKLDNLCDGSTTSRGKKMNRSSYLNALISYAFDKKLYFTERITPELKYKIERKESNK